MGQYVNLSIQIDSCCEIVIYAYVPPQRLCLIFSVVLLFMPRLPLICAHVHVLVLMMCGWIWRSRTGAVVICRVCVSVFSFSCSLCLCCVLFITFICLNNQ